MISSIQGVCWRCEYEATVGIDGNNEVYKMNADGSKETNLTNNVADDGAATWSPDGTKIAFQSTRGSGNLDIVVMNADGSDQTTVTFGLSEDLRGAPDWQPIPPVGGIAELPAVAGTPLARGESSGPSEGVLAGIAAAVVAGAVFLGGGAAWYARRRG